jgi:hypothetical protein
MPWQAKPTKMWVNGFEVKVRPKNKGFHALILRGALNSQVNLTIQMNNKEPVEFAIYDQSLGLPDGYQDIVQARDKVAVPYNDGDKTRVFTRVRI